MQRSRSAAILTDTSPGDRKSFHGIDQVASIGEGDLLKRNRKVKGGESLRQFSERDLHLDAGLVLP
jgi:hypothetical protein